MLERALLAALAFGCLAGCQLREESQTVEPEDTRPILVEVPELLERTPKPSRIIYLNREGATLYPGRDEASENASSIVLNAGLERYEVPAFRGTPARWDQIATCIRNHFAPYDVEVVERRPLVPGYLMAVLGGEANGLRPTAVDGDDHDHGTITGLAPFNGQAIENAVVLVFSRQLRENARTTCETAAMEIAHAYGLDHSRSCRDLMSYVRPCGTRSFREEEVACGEREDRPCTGPSPTQSSHRRLLEVLGPAGQPIEDRR